MLQRHHIDQSHRAVMARKQPSSLDLREQPEPRATQILGDAPIDTPLGIEHSCMPPPPKKNVWHLNVISECT